MTGRGKRALGLLLAAVMMGTIALSGLAIPAAAEEAGDSLVNLALGKPATQSSDEHGGVAQRAVDGNTSGHWGDGSVTHTGSDLYSWWEVDLGQMEAIGTIRIWNRTDCCNSRLNNAYVFVSESPFVSKVPEESAVENNVLVYRVSSAAPQLTEFTVNHWGRYVRVQLPIQEYLSLAEVEVLQVGVDALRNIVYSETGPTNQSVTATLTPAEGIEITNNGGSAEYTFETNGSFTFEYIDEEGVNRSRTATVDNIDKIAPVTLADAPDVPVEHEVTVTLSATDELSVVEATYYRIDGGEIRTGTTIHLAGAGLYSLSYWSVDVAGNTEEPSTVEITVLPGRLSGLTISSGTLAFRPDTTLYQMLIPADASSLTLTPSTVHASLSPYINGEPLAGGGQVLVETPPGANRMTIELRDVNDEVVNTYVVVALRPSAARWSIQDAVAAAGDPFDMNGDGVFTREDAAELLQWMETVAVEQTVNESAT